MQHLWLYRIWRIGLLSVLLGLSGCAEMLASQLSTRAVERPDDTIHITCKLPQTKVCKRPFPKSKPTYYTSCRCITPNKHLQKRLDAAAAAKAAREAKAAEEAEEASDDTHAPPTP